MKEENGNEMDDKAIVKETMNLLSDACCLTFECKSDEGRALAFMIDSALKYAQVIHRGDDVLLAAADYAAYEEGVSHG